MFDKSCKFAPSKPFAKHCNKTNSGAYSAKNKNRKITGQTGKGYFSCSKHCRYYQQKEK